MDATRELPTPEPVTRILLVEDDVADAYVARRVLEKEGGETLRLEQVDRLSTALERLIRDRYGCVLLDLNLPDSFGFATFREISRLAPETPVVVLSGLDDQRIAVKAVREGAQDYLVKGSFDGPLLLRAIRYAIARHRTTERWRNLSFEDELTGLYNRRGFLALGDRQLKLAQRKRQRLLVLFADLDGLKRINDAHGHDAGNQAITEAAGVLRSSFRETDVVARLGGDEFGVLLYATDREHFERLASRLRSQVEAVNRRPLRDFRLSLSFGVAELRPHDSCTLEELVQRADAAMYAAKRKKKD